MWTSREDALREADRRALELAGWGALRTEDRLATRVRVEERWSRGLAKNLFDVTYRRWRPWCLGRLVGDGERVTGTRWRSFEWGAPPRDWRRGSGWTPVEDEATLGWLRRAIGAWLEREVEPHGFLSRPERGGGGDRVFEGEVWAAIPGEELVVRFDADTGAFIGWRYEAWFAETGPEAGPERDEDELRRLAEASPLFPAGYRFTEAWPSTDRPGHLEMLWERWHEGEEVENDFFFATVNRRTGRLSEALVNRSDLDPELDLDEDRAAEILDRAFRETFPGATRCGRIRRLYLEIPGERVKRRAFVGNAVEATGPVQIAVGRGGEILRVDRTG